jgi:hypothetical protein
MRSALVVLAILMLGASVAFSSPEIGQTEFGGDFWFRYHRDQTDEATQQSTFSVERGYFGVGHAWSPQVNGQMTINFFSSSDGFDYTGWDFELRDAYLNLHYFIPGGKIRVGLQKNYFGTVHDWKYMTLRRSLADAVGVVKERDYGIAFLGMIPNGLGEWTIGVMNGEGFSSGLSPAYADKQPGVMANLRIMPMMETMINLSFLRDKRYVYPWLTTTYDNSIGYEDRTAFSFTGKVGRGPFSLMGEYLQYDYPIPDPDNPDNEAVNVTGTGFMIFPTFRLTPKLDLVGRYDSWDPDTDSDDGIWQAPYAGTLSSGFESVPQPWWLPTDYDQRYYFVKHSVYVVGFNYNITDRMEGEPGVLLQFNWQRIDPGEDIVNMEPLDQIDSFMVQVRWGWGGLDF